MLPDTAFKDRLGDKLGAIFAKDDIVRINSALYEELKERAELEELKRFRMCMHLNHESLVQEMVIALKKGSYVQPHCHPKDRIESYSILSGILDVIFFDDRGNVTEKLTLSSESEGDKIVRIGAGHWHMPIARSEWVIYHEILQGPFDKDEIIKYSAWSPGQNDKVEIEKFVGEIYEK